VVRWVALPKSFAGVVAAVVVGDEGVERCEISDCAGLSNSELIARPPFGVAAEITFFVAVS